MFCVYPQRIIRQKEIKNAPAQVGFEPSPGRGILLFYSFGSLLSRKEGNSRKLQVEVALGVVVADALDDLLQGLVIVGVLAVLDPAAD